MTLLLDTQCWLWRQGEPERLGRSVLASPEDPDNALFLSAASPWGIAIKYAVGKLAPPIPPAQYLPIRMEPAGTHSLAVTQDHGANEFRPGLGRRLPLRYGRSTAQMY